MMRWNNRGCGRQVSIALAGFLILSVPAWSQDATPEATKDAPVKATKPRVEVTIPTITAVGSSIDEGTLRSIFSGDFAGHADELATLSARSIAIPELHISFDVPGGASEAVNGEVIFHDIAIANVTDGIARSLSVGSSETKTSDGGTAKFGKMSADSFDIGGLLGFYGLVEAKPVTEPKVIYRNLAVEGGTVTSPEAICTIRGATVASFKARPLKVSFMDFIALAQKMDTTDEKPSPETIALFVNFYIDLIEAIEVSPIKFDGFDCAGTTKDAKPVTVSVGAVTVGEFAHGRYPDVTATDLKVVAAGDGDMSLGTFQFKGFDVSGTLATLKNAGTNLDEAWFEAHYRELIPTFDGFALSKLSVDVPDEKNPGERIKAAVENFDLTLKDYINGIPTDISTLASHIVVALPTNSDDETVLKLKALGIKNVDVGYDVAIKWEKDASEIRLNRFSVTGIDMGAIAVTSVIGQATEALFSVNTMEALGAAMGLTLKRVKVDIDDAGLADLLLQSAAAESGKDIAEFRRSLSGLVQGTLLMFLGGAANATDVTSAVGEFLNGKKSLSVTVTAKATAGVTFDELNALKEDPTGIVEKVDIEAAAR